MAPAADPVRVAEPAPAAVPPREIDFTGPRVCVTGADISLRCDQSGAAAATRTAALSSKVGIGPNCLAVPASHPRHGGPVPGAFAGSCRQRRRAKVLGGVKIVAHAVIVANAVVLATSPRTGPRSAFPRASLPGPSPSGPPRRGRHERRAARPDRCRSRVCAVRRRSGAAAPLFPRAARARPAGLAADPRAHARRARATVPRRRSDRLHRRHAASSRHVPDRRAPARTGRLPHHQLPVARGDAARAARCGAQAGPRTRHRRDPSTDSGVAARAVLAVRPGRAGRHRADERRHGISAGVPAAARHRSSRRLSGSGGRARAS